MLGTILLLALQSPVMASLPNSDPAPNAEVIQEVSAEAEAQRRAQVTLGNEDSDLARLLEFARPDELNRSLEKMFGPSIDGEAAVLSPGLPVDAFTVKIDVVLSLYPAQPQRLVMSYTDQNGKAAHFETAVSGGAGRASQVLIGHCHTVNGTFTQASSATYGGVMTNPVFFRGRRGKENSNPLTYAIHGLQGNGYLNRLGSPASHGCLRVKREAAQFIRQTVLRSGMKKTVICVH